jgi:hypothetical protein
MDKIKKREAGKASIHQCECAICQSNEDRIVKQYHEQINLLLSCLTEPQRRWYVGFLSDSPDSPSDVELARITGISRDTIRRGRQELSDGLVTAAGHLQRQKGAGRPKSEKKT